MLPAELLERLGDGRPRPRSALAASLGITATGLEAEFERLEAAGLSLVRGDGDSVSLAEPIGWIELAGVETAIDARQRARIGTIERFLEIESTNRYLLDVAPPAPGSLRVAIAEYQHGGRGRRGRRWTMPPGAGIALSAAWRFGRRPESLPALSLAVGAAARRAIRDVTDLSVGLKWPNDLVLDGGKLGGILVELDRVDDGGALVVAGIGINVRVPAPLLAALSEWPQGARDLRTATPAAVDRSRLAAALISRLAELFADFASSGFGPYREEWLASHVLHDARVEVHGASGTAHGIVRGIDTDGALIVESEAGDRQRIVSGDVTLRAST